MVIEKDGLTSEQVISAKKSVKAILNQFNNQRAVIILNQKNLDEIADVVSFTIPHLNLALNVNADLANFSFSLDYEGMYLNVHCLLQVQDAGIPLDNCYIGKVSLSWEIIAFFIKPVASMFFDEKMQELTNTALKNISINNSKITITINDASYAKNQIKHTIKNNANALLDLQSEIGVDMERLALYVEQLKSSKIKSASIAPYIQALFTLAEQRSSANTAQIENKHALWALILVADSENFFQRLNLFNGIETGFTKRLTLRDRTDLALHFVYSIMLEQLGQSKFSNNVGILKELIDTNLKGSGFSFVDLAADKAGTEFSKLLSSNDKQAINAQHLLAATSDEGLYFPATEDLLEGITSQEFSEVFQNTASKEFSSIDAALSERILALPLYLDEEVHK